jgi:putative chitinase
MIDRAKFFATLRAKGFDLFGTSLSQGQVDGINGLLDAFDTHGDGKRDTLAYGLATAYHETDKTMQPVREGKAKTDAGARRAVNNLAAKRGPKSAVARYARPTGRYGHVYYGRGHVQLTWLDNYEKASAVAGVDLVQFPDKMLVPEISARVLWAGLLGGWWGPEGLRFYLDRGDFVGARRTVNGTDKAELIAGYARKFDTALQGAGWFDRPAPQKAPPSAPKPVAAPTPAPKAQSPWAAIFRGVLGMFGKGNGK